MCRSQMKDHSKTNYTLCNCISDAIFTLMSYYSSENVLIDDEHYHKIADFGLSKTLPQNQKIASHINLYLHSNLLSFTLHQSLYLIQIMKKQPIIAKCQQVKII